MTVELSEGLRGDRNQNGQAMGRKGLQTRQRLIDATVEQLETTRLRDLRVSEIARKAGTSAATFYVYFPDVTDAVLAALDEFTQSTPELLALVKADWGSDAPDERARQIVQMYVDFWTSHAGLLRVRNLASDEGDERFRRAREVAIRPMLEATAAAVDRAQRAGWVPAELDPAATAGVLMAMLERFAAVQNSYRPAPDRSAMVAAAAHILAGMMGPAQR
jgi:AcrR family transcriptional regulator